MSKARKHRMDVIGSRSITRRPRRLDNEENFRQSSGILFFVQTWVKSVGSQSAKLMADAAIHMIESLDGRQRDKVCRPFPDDQERHQWFYTPTDHGGLPLAAMSSAQHRKGHRLVATGLSRAGYVTVAAIIGLENVLDHLEGWSTNFDRERDATRFFTM
jgi:hypothetical protein